MADKYYSFMLRLWCSDSHESPAWRVTLENPQTCEVIGFRSLDALLEYLNRLVFEPADEDEQNSPQAG